ncbi:universal stress protein [Halostella sp. JP-L12]|uniref:universal stress protein n=1 Tax=Halostella TaxID=1843185 RepID=UPI000EF8060B|nr:MULTISPECIES: universal stress protein [Halostella]NHN49142.1 universal stress protein [Halostella sp. JP-L12]
MFRDVLVPTDGSDCAGVAVEYAADLAGRYDADVHVLNVVDNRRVEHGPHYDERREAAAELVDSTADRLEDDGLGAERAVRTGVPYEEIEAYASEAGVDLVAMGTRGRTGVDEHLLGSVTERVVRCSDAPVLTVRTMDDSAVTFPYDDVLVPTDGSDGAEAAVGPAASVAGTYGATLHSLSVVDTRSLGIDVRSSALVDALEDQARDAVEAVAERASAASVANTETAVDHGLPSECVRAYVEENDVDLVVMGTHGRSGVSRYLLGSVAEKLVRTSPVPVMTVREPTGDEA